MKATNIQNFMLRKDGSSGALSVSRPSPFVPVAVIVRRCSQDQMIRANTSGVVAHMTHDPISRIAYENLVRGARRTPCVVSGHGKDAVSVFVGSARPLPTPIRLVDVVQETIGKTHVLRGSGAAFIATLMEATRASGGGIVASGETIARKFAVASDTYVSRCDGSRHTHSFPVVDTYGEL